MGVTSPVLELWLLFACLQKRPKFPFGPWAIESAIVHGGQKMESAQKKPKPKNQTMSVIPLPQPYTAIFLQVYAA